ncbi:VP4 [Kummerowia striata gokushovirus]|nr:VP4 [Kummerowia striata gokushovirus]
MPCDCPLSGYYSKEVNPVTGKRGITFNRNASFSGVRIPIPCQQCAGCRLERSRQWAMRCMHENQMHRESCFVTLTYDDKNLPQGGTLVKRDLQLFMKNVRNHRGSGIRFYGCGEYGERSFRPHYHVILYGVDFYDKKFVKNAPCGEPMYHSAELRKYWPYGNNIIGSVTFDSAAYVARYIMKKVMGDQAQSYYEWYDTVTGEITLREPEFTNMSRRPGIGAGWYAKFGGHAYQHDSVIIKEQEVRPPRYYDLKYELDNPVHYRLIKEKRTAKARQMPFSEKSPDRRRVREIVRDARLKLKGRVL